MQIVKINLCLCQIYIYIYKYLFWAKTNERHKREPVTAALASSGRAGGSHSHEIFKISFFSQSRGTI